MYATVELTRQMLILTLRVSDGPRSTQNLLENLDILVKAGGLICTYISVFSSTNKNRTTSVWRRSICR